MRRAWRGLAAIGLAALVAPAVAQTAPDAGGADHGRLQVTGRASLSLPPDFATVDVGVESRAATPGAALDANSAAARRIIDVARGMNVPAADVATASVSLQPELRSSRDAAEVVAGYRATNVVSVRLRALDSLGEFLRKAVEGGANRIQTVAFGLAEPGKAEDEVRAAAVRDARRQAEVLAGAAGARLGPIERLVSPAEAGRPAPPARFSVARGPAPVPIAAGAVTAEADVLVVWTLAP